MKYDAGALSGVSGSVEANAEVLGCVIENQNRPCHQIVADGFPRQGEGSASGGKGKKPGGAGRNRTADRGFADLGLTTWRPRPSPRQTKNPRQLRGRRILERETGFEPATSTLARSHSTTELLPLGSSIITKRRMGQQTAATTCETIRRAQFTAEAWRSRRRSGSNATAYRAYGL